MHLERRLSRTLVAALGCTALLACSEEEGGGSSPGDDAGSEAGGAASGGAAAGGRASGGAAAGGTSAGGASAGGASAGGTSAGGASAAGSPGAGGGAAEAGAGDGGPDGSPEAGGDAGDAGDAGVELTAQEWARARTLSPLPDVPASPTNAYADSAAAATLGQMLFFDKSYSGPLAVDSDLGLTGATGTMSCASCHAGEGLDDDRSNPPTVSIGANFHTRNAPSAVNSVFYQWTNWGGRFSAPWELPLPVAESPAILNSTRLAIAHLIFDKYRPEYETIFGAMDAGLSDLGRFPATGKPKAATNPTDGPWEMMASGDRDIVNRIFANYGKVLEAYMRKLVSRNTPFDAYVAGDSSALSREATLGLKLFVGDTNCTACHLGPFLSDGLFHNIGVPQTGTVDDGRFKDIPGLLSSPFNSAGAFSDDAAFGQAKLLGLTNPPAEDARGTFRTPTLRGVARTAPYMHAGQLATLDDVIAHYSQGGATPPSGTLSTHLFPLNLSPDEAANLVAFLQSLNGEAVSPALLQDTSRP